MIALTATAEAEFGGPPSGRRLTIDSLLGMSRDCSSPGTTEGARDVALELARVVAEADLTALGGPCAGVEI